jgi:hypothetical protein
MIPVWPASLPQTPRRGEFSGGPRDERVRFEPDRGPPIERQGVTAETSLFQATFPQLKPAQVATFEAFFRTTLARGVLPFAWRDPLTGLAWEWKVAGGQGNAYSLSSRGATLVDLSVQMMRMPGPPWWQAYATTDGALRLPVIVADYTAGLFGIDLAQVPAASVAAASGTFDVWTTSTGDVTTIDLAETVTPGDIPATAPMGVALIRAFAP